VTGEARPFSRAAALASRLRPMLPSDLDAVLALEHELFPDDAWTPEMFADEVSQPPDSRLYLVAEGGDVRDQEGAEDRADSPGQSRDACLTGYAGLMFVPDGVSADVLTIAVAEASWGKGVGSALLGALVDAARRRGCEQMFLEVRKDNPRARGLYLRRGFEEIGVRRGYYQPAGVDAIVMRKDLKAS
jgi:[ribosomal protein S18]-alanine N-acetyltransferase